MKRGASHVLGCLAGLLAASLVAGCTGSTPPHLAAAPVVSASPAPSVAPTPTPTVAVAPELKVPKVRWDQVPRGALPRSCTTHGSTSLHVTSAGTAYATGPSLTCVPQDPYLVRAVVKVATYRGNGHWVYLTQVRPTAPARDVVAAQTSGTSTCKKGDLVRAVSSFVITWPSGKEVRYKRIGRSVRCP
jgi:hypothetical protein